MAFLNSWIYVTKKTVDPLFLIGFGNTTIYVRIRKNKLVKF